MNVSPKKLLTQLVHNGIIDQNTPDTYELTSLQKNIPIVDYLTSKTPIDKAALLKATAEVMQVSFVDLTTSPVDPQAVSLLSESIARRYMVLPYRFDPKAQILHLASSDPFNTNLTEFIEKKIGKKVVLTLADAQEISKGINLSYTQGLSPEVSEALKEYQPDIAKKPIEDIGSIIKEAPIAKIVSTILEFAIKRRTSDIHIEPEEEKKEEKTRVRYRVDGILNEKLSLPKSIHEALVSSIKILSDMKIDERRIPQDGRFSLK